MFDIVGECAVARAARLLYCREHTEGSMMNDWYGRPWEKQETRTVAFIQVWWAAGGRFAQGGMVNTENMVGEAPPKRTAAKI